MRTRLEAFSKSEKFEGSKGRLSLALVITDLASKKTLPLEPDDFKTENEGQVLGLGHSAVQTILKRHKIVRTLAREGGRTSRGNMGAMKTYVEFLNSAYKDGCNVDFKEIEKFWIEKVEQFFSAKPFQFRLDGHIGLRAAIRNLMSQAEARQKEISGTMFLGTVMQHLVGAKLELVLAKMPKDKPIAIEHHGSNQNDTSGRGGDFDIGDVAIHVSSAPTELLIQKCIQNLDSGKQPIIITVAKKTTLAEGLADNAKVGDRIDIVEFEQFISTNIYEMSLFDAKERRIKTDELIERYNQIIDLHETDPSLRIETQKSK